MGAIDLTVVHAVSAFDAAHRRLVPGDLLSRPMNPALRVIALDHIVLKCADVDTTLAWYLDVLGLQPVRLAEWRAGDAPFPSVRVDDGTILDLIRADDAAIADGVIDDGRLDHFCLVVEPTDLAALDPLGTLRRGRGPGHPLRRTRQRHVDLRPRSRRHGRRAAPLLIVAPGRRS